MDTEVDETIVDFAVGEIVGGDVKCWSVVGVENFKYQVGVCQIEIPNIEQTERELRILPKCVLTLTLILIYTSTSTR